MDDMNSMRDKSERDHLRARAMAALAAQGAYWASIHAGAASVLGLLDLADEGEMFRAERDAARAELTAIEAVVTLSGSCDCHNPEGLLDLVQYAGGRADFSTFRAVHAELTRLGAEALRTRISADQKAIEAGWRSAVVEDARQRGWAEAVRTCADVARREYAENEATARGPVTATVSGDPSSRATQAVVEAGKRMVKMLAEERSLTAARILEKIEMLEAPEEIAR